MVGLITQCSWGQNFWKSLVWVTFGKNSIAWSLFFIIFWLQVGFTGISGMAKLYHVQYRPPPTNLHHKINLHDKINYNQSPFWALFFLFHYWNRSLYSSTLAYVKCKLCVQSLLDFSLYFIVYTYFSTRISGAVQATCKHCTLQQGDMAKIFEWHFHYIWLSTEC